MVGPIRTLDDLARKGFDLHVHCRACDYSRTIPIEEVRAAFRERGLSEDWSAAARHFRCLWCNHKRAQLSAYVRASPGALEVLREAVRAVQHGPAATPAVRAALDDLRSACPNKEALEELWRALGKTGGVATGRAAGAHHALVTVLIQLGREHDDGPHVRIDRERRAKRSM